MPTSSSSIVASAPQISFNCSSGNTASNVDCTIQNNADSFSWTGKYENDVRTFFSLRFPNELSNGEKERLMKNVFVPKNDFVFPKTKRHFCYSWLGLYPWLAYSPWEYWWGILSFLCVFLQQSCYQKEKIGASFLDSL